MLLVLDRVDIFEKIFFLFFESVGQKIINAFVIAFILEDITEEEFDIYFTILQFIEVLLIVLDGIEEVFRSAIDRIVNLDMMSQVEAVGVQKEDNFLDLTDI